METASEAGAAAQPPFANPDRGEHELPLGGKIYLLRPSSQAIRAIEAKTGKSTLALVRLGNTADMTLDELGLIAAELIRAGAAEDDRFTRNVSPDRLAELIFEEGMPRVISRLTLCLYDAATGGRTTEGEAKAAPATTDPAGAA